jgi:hypothetical protein
VLPEPPIPAESVAPPASEGVPSEAGAAPSPWANRQVRAVLAVAALAAVVTGTAGALRTEGLDEEEQARQAAVEQTAWRNYLRQAPVPLEGGFAAGTLAATDGLSPDERYEDYYAYVIPDSAAFSVVVTAAGFAPDLIVATPDGRRLAASTLWQTADRAEVAGLRGPGRFVVTVTAREPGVGGAYELSAGPSPPARALELGDAVDSTLGLGRRPRAGRYEDRYALSAPSGRPVIATVRARGFRPRLNLLGPEGEVAEPWGNVAHLDTDTLHTASFRYHAGWDAPYTLLVSSHEGGARGDYAVAFEPIRIPDIATDGRAVRGTLGENGWYRENRYVDAYRFDAEAGTTVRIEARSEAFEPALTLKLGTRTLATNGGATSARLDRDLEGGLYEVEVSSADPDATGDYTLAVTVDTPEGPRSQTFTTESRRVGTTMRGHSFEVTVRRVVVSPAGEGRVRVRLRVEERSLDFEGEWDAWRDRVARTRLTDDTGRAYFPVDASGGEDDAAVAPGELRRGEITFEAEAGGGRPRVITLLYPIGVGGRVVVAVPVELRR